MRPKTGARREVPARGGRDSQHTDPVPKAYTISAQLMTTTHSKNIWQYTTLAASTLKEIANAWKMPVLGITATYGLTIASALEASKTQKAEMALVVERVHNILCCIIQLTNIDQVDGSLSPAILFDVAKFTEILQRIVRVLNEQQKMGRVKQFFKQSERSAQLQSCKAELQQSLESFTSHCARMNLDGIARIEMETQEYHNQLLALLAENPSLTHSDTSSLINSTLTSSSSLSLSVLPPPPQIFHGRESELEAILTTLGEDCAARVAILGTGGMGKTTLVTAVLHHPEVASLFPEGQIYFVPCQAVMTTQELLAEIASHIGIERTSRIKRVLQCLDYAKSLLVLDNFETPWEAVDERNGVEKLLGQLADLRNLSIIVTMRGAERPGGIQWTRPFLPPLLPISNSAALKTFLDIADEPEDDESSTIHDLLECTGNLPLAITLISSAAADEGCAATLARWRQTKTLALSDGYDKRSSLDISIGLSLTSPRMTDEALELLSLLAALPDGLADVELTQALSGVIPNILAVKAVLLRTALAFMAADRRLKLLVPVREFVAAAYPPPRQMRTAIWLYLHKLLELWNNFDNLRLSPMIVSQITANMQSLRSLTVEELESKENTGTEREADALRAALWIEEFVRVSNHPKGVPWTKLMQERIKYWRHHPVYIPYLHAVMGHEQYSAVEMEAIIAEGNEYFQDKGAFERARWYARVANHYQVYRNNFRKTIEFRQLAVDTITSIPYATPLKDAQKAKDAAERAYQYALEISPIVGPHNNTPVAVTLSVLGRSAMGLGHFAQASRYLEDSLAFFEGSEVFGMQPHVKAQSILSVLHSLKTEYLEARLILQDSMPPRDPRHPPTLSRIFTDMNIALLDIELEEDPEDIARRVEEMRHHLRTTQVAPIGFVFLDMIVGELKLFQGDLGDAHHLLRQSFSKLDGTSNESSVACALRLGDWDFRLGSLDSAFRWSIIALAFTFRIQDKFGKIQALRCLGKVFVANENYQSARVLLELALEQLTVMDVHRWRADCLVQLAQVRKYQNDKEGQMTLLSESIPLFARSRRKGDVARVAKLVQESRGK
ncbi:NB-ARC domain-containing protein [Mycena indigotica]|uniref:NB-ARC domain-containing protein n=1 Tax=Mycena indigotica TaxID=2126181 RepID=A0A8H6SSG9_9AGAR|nr:NB-ARC domain-containing protein [Mycena indigotica]KAF7303567.1 NB-ARC domain-containing protein [Mycena indigotica]